MLHWRKLPKLAPAQWVVENPRLPSTWGNCRSSPQLLLKIIRNSKALLKSLWLASSSVIFSSVALVFERSWGYQRIFHLSPRLVAGSQGEPEKGVLSKIGQVIRRWHRNRLLSTHGHRNSTTLKRYGPWAFEKCFSLAIKLWCCSCSAHLQNEASHSQIVNHKKLPLCCPVMIQLTSHSPILVQSSQIDPNIPYTSVRPAGWVSRVSSVALEATWRPFKQSWDTGGRTSESLKHEKLLHWSHHQRPKAPRDTSVPGFHTPANLSWTKHWKIRMISSTYLHMMHPQATWFANKSAYEIIWTTGQSCSVLPCV